MRPRCYNRTDRPPGYWRHGFDQLTGKPVQVFISNAWSEDRCATWDGRGIGPTEETTNFPLAHGWDCSGCRWKPIEQGDQ